MSPAAWLQRFTLVLESASSISTTCDHIVIVRLSQNQWWWSDGCTWDCTDVPSHTWFSSLVMAFIKPVMPSLQEKFDQVQTLKTKTVRSFQVTKIASRSSHLSQQLGSTPLLRPSFTIRSLPSKQADKKRASLMMMAMLPMWTIMVVVVLQTHSQEDCVRPCWMMIFYINH